MDKSNPPFVEDAKVARRSEPHFGKPGQWKVAIVGRSYKNGRFILRGGDKQQWRPEAPDKWRPYWHARRAGNGDPYGIRDALIIWDATTEAMIEKDNADFAHRYRLSDMQSIVEKLKPEDIKPDVLVQIIELLKPEK